MDGQTDGAIPLHMRPRQEPPLTDLMKLFQGGVWQQHGNTLGKVTIMDLRRIFPVLILRAGLPWVSAALLSLCPLSPRTSHTGAGFLRQAGHLTSQAGPWGWATGRLFPVTQGLPAKLGTG